MTGIKEQASVMNQTLVLRMYICGKKRHFR